MGKKLRLSRISTNGRFVTVPMDHGVSMGPINGIVDPLSTVYLVAEAGATAVFLHKGLARMMTTAPCGLIVHLSASTSMATDPNAKVLVGGVEDAMRLGADAVSIHVNVGAHTEEEMLADMGIISSTCEEWGMPLVAMMYPRGPGIDNPFDPDLVAHAARLGAELGADVIKTSYTGDADSFAKVIEGCPVPIIIAGGPRCDTPRDTLEMVRGALDAGSQGVAFGRNVFGCEDPGAMVRALHAVIVDDVTVDEALEVMG